MLPAVLRALASLAVALGVILLFDRLATGLAVTGRGLHHRVAARQKLTNEAFEGPFQNK
jgi:hypothetical protein